MLEDPKVICGNKRFKYFKDFEKYVKDLIYNKIGECRSVRNTEYFNDLHELLLRHPMADEKLKDFHDFSIEPNYYGKGLAVWIWGLGYRREISWRTCIKGIEKSYMEQLKDAMRYAVNDQIREFKKFSNGECSICRYNRLLEVDHVVKFRTIMNQYFVFCKNHDIELPTQFIKTDDPNNRKDLPEGDFKYYWVNFHDGEKQLRILCRHCNQALR